jgi:hypothetical protein
MTKQTEKTRISGRRMGMEETEAHWECAAGRPLQGNFGLYLRFLRSITCVDPIFLGTGTQAPAFRSFVERARRLLPQPHPPPPRDFFSLVQPRN